jgi:DinB superfamily
MKLTAALLFTLCAPLFAADMTVAKMYDSQLSIAESEIVPLVKAMPESAFNFAPTKGSFEKVRTFGGQAKHIATVMYMCAASAAKEKPPVDTGAGEDGPATVKTKAEIVAYLQGAFTYAHKVMGTLTAQNELDLVAAPFPGMPPMARAALANLTIWHSFDHYGQMVVYARMNEVIPPASAPPPPPSTKKK